MKITDIVVRKTILHQLLSRDKKGVVKELAQAISVHCKSDRINMADIVEAVLKREKMGTTGIGRGIAIPHAKCERLKRVIAAVGRSEPGVDYDSIDGEPVHLVFLVLSPANNSEGHLLALKCIMDAIKRPNFCKFMKSAKGTKDMEYILKEAEEGVQVS